MPLTANGTERHGLPYRGLHDNTARKVLSLSFIDKETGLTVWNLPKVTYLYVAEPEF